MHTKNFTVGATVETKRENEVGAGEYFTVRALNEENGNAVLEDELGEQFVVTAAELSSGYLLV